MGAEGMVGIAAQKLFGDDEPPPEVKKKIVERDPEAHRHLQGRRLGPRRRRHRSARHAATSPGASSSSRHKKVERPARRRGIIPV